MQQIVHVNLGHIAIYGPVGCPKKFNAPQLHFGLYHILGADNWSIYCHILTLSIKNYMMTNDISPELRIHRRMHTRNDTM